MNKKASPLVSVIVVNWNGKKWLDNCFNSLIEQDYKNVQIIFVDNASSDDSVTYMTKHFPKVEIYQNDDNLGFAGGNSVGFLHARGEYVYLLNNDTAMSKDCISKLVEFMQDKPFVGSAQSKIRLMNDPTRLDVVGSFWSDSTFLYHYGIKGNESLQQYNVAIPVYSNKGASMILRASALQKVGFLDDDFWCYYEETDLCARLWLAGYECWYAPSALMMHAGGGTALTFDNSFIQYHNFKNKLLSFLKCYQKRTLLYVLPMYLAMNLAIVAYWLAKRKFKHCGALFKAIWWNITNIRKTLRKRSITQALRTRSDREVFRNVRVNPGIRYFIALLTKKYDKYDDKSLRFIENTK